MPIDMDRLDFASGFALTSDQRKPSVEIDYERYEQYFEDSDLTDDQKREFIAALWSIIVNFVDLGFGVHPAQQAQEACGKPSAKTEDLHISDDDRVEWDGKLLSENFDDAAASKPESVMVGFDT